MCLDSADTYSFIYLAPCKETSATQRWRFKYYNPVYYDIIKQRHAKGVDDNVLEQFSKYLNAPHVWEVAKYTTKAPNVWLEPGAPSIK